MLHRSGQPKTLTKSGVSQNGSCRLSLRQPFITSLDISQCASRPALDIVNTAFGSYNVLIATLLPLLTTKSATPQLAYLFSCIWSVLIS